MASGGFCHLHSHLHATTCPTRTPLQRCNGQQRRLLCKSTAATSQPGAESRSHETEVVVIGSGIGGLSCAAMLAAQGVRVTVAESHDIPGGAAHAWVQKGYHFESGPSLFSGMDGRGQGANPIAHVLQAIGEPLDLIEYNRWNVIMPEGQFLTEVGPTQFEEVLQHVSPAGISDWRELRRVMEPLAKAAVMIPPAAIRADPAVAITALGRYLPSLIRSGRDAGKLVGPFSAIIDNGLIKDPFVRNWLDLLCFLLSGLPADGTIAAEVAFMFADWYKPNAVLQYPRGGSQAIVNALIRGIKKHGGRVLLGAHVERIELQNGKASGVRLRGGDRIAASKAVVSNASLWDTLPLLPEHKGAQQFCHRAQEIPLNRSFMHLHLGFDASGLDDIELHHIVVNSWEGGVDTEQNVVLMSIPSAIDSSMAPPGKHALHAYLPATEPFSHWEGFERGSPGYEAFKHKRSQVLWRAVEKIIPDIRQRTEVEMVGTPLTHRHFLRRHAGTYGPGIQAGKGTFPAPTTPIPGLLCCGDSTFPGIGVPAVAASGSIAANTLVPFWKHLKMLDRIGL